jgi:drug/metabolite transporter (DMT)-like permease
MGDWMTVSPLVAGLALFAALLHASWNAVLRSGADRLWTITVMGYATTVVAAPIAAFLPVPRHAAWPYLAASSLLQVAYSVLLANAYRFGGLSQVYPVVRGVVPAIVTLAGFVFAGQRPGFLPLVGVALISFGIIGIALGRGRASPQAIGLALATGLVVAAYVIIDGVGARLAGDAQSYVAWIFLIYGAVMPFSFWALRGQFAGALVTREGLKAAAAGLVVFLSYGATVSALALGPIGPVSALRETSVVFSVLIGRLVLREPLSGRRVAACLGVACGAVLIAAA